MTFHALARCLTQLSADQGAFSRWKSHQFITKLQLVNIWTSCDIWPNFCWIWGAVNTLAHNKNEINSNGLSICFCWKRRRCRWNVNGTFSVFMRTAIFIWPSNGLVNPFCIVSSWQNCSRTFQKAVEVRAFAWESVVHWSGINDRLITFFASHWLSNLQTFFFHLNVCPTAERHRSFSSSRR